jgi:hypothetical protein
MWNCEDYLRELARSVEPTAAQKASASRSQQYLRDLLRQGQFGSRILDAFLSGSYARDTAISPIDDVDIVVLIDSDGWKGGIWDARPEPEKILQSFARAIRYRYPESSVHVQRRSVRLEMFHLNVDVVPAIDLGDLEIEIPDGDSQGWIKSAPRRHTCIATEINQANRGLFKPLVKLLKYWNRQLPDSSYLKSFAIETMAGTLFRNVSLPTVQDGLRLFFDFVAGRDGKAILFEWPSNYGVHLSWWAHELFDLAGTGSNLVERVDASRRRKFLDQAVRSRDLLAAAEKARDSTFAASYLGRALKMG